MRASRPNFLWNEGFEVIRQAISCDICASEKRQTNHWFVAYEQAGELRVSGWSSRHKLRPGSKHLCGQTCLHKLVDEFMAKAIAVRAQRPVDEPVEEIAPQLPAVVDASLTSDAAYAEDGQPCYGEHRAGVVGAHYRAADDCTGCAEFDGIRVSTPARIRDARTRNPSAAFATTCLSASTGTGTPAPAFRGVRSGARTIAALRLAQLAC